MVLDGTFHKTYVRGFSTKLERYQVSHKKRGLHVFWALALPMYSVMYWYLFNLISRKLK